MLLCQGFVQQGQLAGIRLFEQGLDGLLTHGTVGAEQFQRGQCRFNFSTKAVVAHHILRVGGQVLFLTRERIKRFASAKAVAHNPNFVTCNFDGIVGQSLQKHQGVFIALGHDFVQGFNSLIGLAVNQPPHLCQAHGLCRAGHEGHCQR